MKKLLSYKLFEFLTNVHFHNYANGKSKTGIWGSTDENEYKHLGYEHNIFNFNIGNKVANVSAESYDPVVSESLFNIVATSQQKSTYNTIMDSNIDDDWIYLDYIVNIALKKKGYDGVIYRLQDHKIAVDLREHTIEELENNFQEWMDSEVNDKINN